VREAGAGVGVDWRSILHLKWRTTDAKWNERTELELGEVERALDFVEEQLGEEAVRSLRLLFTWVLSIRVLLQEKTLSLKPLRRRVFGSSSEKTRSTD